MTMLSLRGTHGTTVSRAGSIQKNGFNKSTGQLGPGAYFWVDGKFATRLAVSWWDYYSSIKKYDDDGKQACVVFLVELSIDENEFLDLGRHDIKQSLASLCAKRKVGYYSSKQRVYAVISFFMKELEKETGTTYKVFESSITTPPVEFCKYYPIKVLGSPHSYIVLDTGCITILRVSRVRV